MCTNNITYLFHRLNSLNVSLSFSLHFDELYFKAVVPSDKVIFNAFPFYKVKLPQDLGFFLSSFSSSPSPSFFVSFSFSFPPSISLQSFRFKLETRLLYLVDFLSFYRSFESNILSLHKQRHMFLQQEVFNDEK